MCNIFSKNLDPAFVVIFKFRLNIKCVYPLSIVYHYTFFKMQQGFFFGFFFLFGLVACGILQRVICLIANSKNSMKCFFFRNPIDRPITFHFQPLGASFGGLCNLESWGMVPLNHRRQRQHRGQILLQEIGIQ